MCYYYKKNSNSNKKEIEIMKTELYSTVVFEGKTYEINVEKLRAVVSRLEGKEVIFETEGDVDKYLKKHKLYDEVFLIGVNNL